MPTTETNEQKLKGLHLLENEGNDEEVFQIKGDESDVEDI
jgi:hypothetical protein